MRRFLGYYRQFEELSPEAVEAAVEGARDRFASWSRSPVAERAAFLRRVAVLLRREKHQHAELMALEGRYSQLYELQFADLPA